MYFCEGFITFSLWLILSIFPTGINTCRQPFVSSFSAAWEEEDDDDNDEEQESNYCSGELTL